MQLDQNISLKKSNYKCFGKEYQGYETIKPINLLIGKNNAGKSSLLDLIQFVTSKDYEIKSHQYNGGDQPKIRISKLVEDEEISKVFRQNTSGGRIPGNHYKFGKKFEECRLTYNYSSDEKNKFIDLDHEEATNNFSDHLQRLADVAGNPFKNKIFQKLSSERDIIQEPDNPSELELKPNGEGATNIIQNFLNLASLESNYVSKDLLNGLNEIFSPDTFFTDILCQKLSDNNWEIFLEEKDKGRIHLSESGSGLKTIILTLINLILIPSLEKKKLQKYLFCFEELENNLHPSLLRNLLIYIRDTATKNECNFFITTHSNVIIDLFSKDENAQIIHVAKEKNTSVARAVKSYQDNANVLDDLDVRASDLLQANSIIWVEGPSDRIYLNKWIHLISKNKLIEGNHYQIVFYGGRLLSHLTFENSEANISNLIELLTVNRNAAILIDSDKTSRQKPLNSTKKRIIKEIKDKNGFVWVTKGKEIENYIPSSVLNKLFDFTLEHSIKKYDKFDEYLDYHKSGLGKKFLRNKTEFAHKISENFDVNDIPKQFDLKEKVLSLFNFISKVNKRNT